MSKIYVLIDTTTSQVLGVSKYKGELLRLCGGCEVYDETKTYSLDSHTHIPSMCRYKVSLVNVL